MCNVYEFLGLAALPYSCPYIYTILHTSTTNTKHPLCDYIYIYT